MDAHTLTSNLFLKERRGFFLPLQKEGGNKREYSRDPCFISSLISSFTRWSFLSTGRAPTSLCARWHLPMCSAPRALSSWAWTPDTSTFTCPPRTSAAWIWTPTQSPSMWPKTTKAVSHWPLSTLRHSPEYHLLVAEDFTGVMMKVSPRRHSRLSVRGSYVIIQVGMRNILLCTWIWKLFCKEIKVSEQMSANSSPSQCSFTMFLDRPPA